MYSYVARSKHYIIQLEIYCELKPYMKGVDKMRSL